MFRDLIPSQSLSLVKYSGSQIIERLGKEIISNVVASVLSGENIRSLTESLTQRRLLLMNFRYFPKSPFILRQFHFRNDECNF